MIKHLLSTANLDKESVLGLFQDANNLQKENIDSQALKGKRVATLFYEASTRTRISFEIAAKSLGAEVIDLNPAASSAQKGETIEDTARTLANLGVHCVILRHSSSGAALKLAQALSKTSIRVVNAGDGLNEHPTQALLDLYSILQVHRSVAGKKVLIVGDAFHSRVARSNIYLIKKFGAEVSLVGPPTFAPQAFEGFGIRVHSNLQEALTEVDFVIVLRLQKERQALGLIGSLSDYNRFYGLSHKTLLAAGADLKKIKVLHPGPINRGLEIDSELADDESISLIHKQVFNGLYVRMAVLQRLLRE